MKVLIYGDGFLGNKYKEYFEDSVLSVVRINSVEDALLEINLFQPSVVINCIGKTGRPNIDWCEDNQYETTYSNVIVPIFIQEACQRTNTRMVHISTGCMYEGDKEYKEEDHPNFLKSYYSKSKYFVEQALNEDVLQLRVRMPIDGCPSPRNLLTKLLSYEKTINEVNSITVIPDLLHATRKLLIKGETGIFNIVNPEPITHTQILDIYNQYSPGKKIIKEIPKDRLNTKAARSNCTLSTSKLNKSGIYMRNTFQSLEQCIKEYVNAEFAAVL